MSRLIQRIVSPARMPAGTGPNFILSMTTLWTLGAGPAVGDAGAPRVGGDGRRVRPAPAARMVRSEEHTSELQSLMRISYAVFCLKKKKNAKADNAWISIEQVNEIRSTKDVIT